MSKVNLNQFPKYLIAVLSLVLMASLVCESASAQGRPGRRTDNATSGRLVEYLINENTRLKDEMDYLRAQVRACEGSSQPRVYSVTCDCDYYWGSWYNIGQVMGSGASPGEAQAQAAKACQTRDTRCQSYNCTLRSCTTH